VLEDRGLRSATTSRGAELVSPATDLQCVGMTMPGGVRRTALVTGASRGLGRETCRRLATRGFHVIATARDATDASGVAAGLSHERPTADVDSLPLPLDVSNRESIAHAAAHLIRARARIDVLVNNAGVSVAGCDVAAARATLETNFFGPLRVTKALLPLIPPGGVVVMVSSSEGELAGLAPPLRQRFADPALTRKELVGLMNQFIADVASGKHRERGWPSNAYRVSEIALNALVRVWAPKLAERQIAINAADPGNVRTDMGGRDANRSVEQGSASIVWVASNITGKDGPTGEFFRDGRRLEW
jgi:NAD(P)-dependent dehydrogenase (short-subunit alcohol dehydrogenase family)